VKRSEQTLERLGASIGLTDAAKEWVIAAFDPFHDREIDCTGYPDTNSMDSMTECVTLTLQVSAPASAVTAGVTWDCHIVDWPFLGPFGAKASSAQFTTLTTGGGNTCSGLFSQGTTFGPALTFGGLGVFTFLTSANNVDVFVGAQQSQFNLTLDASYLTNPYRVIAKGFEVYNTTPDLYKSGAVVVYQQPVADFNVASTAHYVQTGLPAWGSLRTLLMDAPPASASEALKLPSSRQWDAREGCYVISKLHSCELPPHLGDYTMPMYYVNSPSDVTMYGGSMGTQAWVSTTPALFVLVPLDWNWTNFNQDGAIFTGLSPQSTLTINFRMFVEVFPTTSSSLVNFAHPSPQYNMAALDLYNEISYKAPVGVEVKFNGLGDWFMDGIKAVADVAAPMLSMMPHPAAKAAGIGYQLARGNSVDKVVHTQQQMNRLFPNGINGKGKGNRISNREFVTSVPNAPPISESSRKKHSKSKANGKLSMRK